MHDKLLLVHKFLNEITHIANEQELIRLYESYEDRLDISSEEDVIYQLLQDARALGREILFLKSSVTDISQNRKFATLTAEERTELAEVERIIDENRFCYHFQPIVNTLDGSIYSYEALMRPKSDMGMTPYHVLKYAELTGRLYDIERATFLNVLNMIDSDKTRFKDRRVFINSIPQINLKGRDLRRVGELLVKYSDIAVVELTEQAESDEDELNALKERYLNMGVEIAIDDFGTGYSNVKNLLRYMPDYVKIDRSLISDIQNNQRKRYFVREIIDFCHDTGIKVLAEGVETSEELRAVILLGVDLIQGYYTARPDSEIIDSIPYHIRQEIKICQQERQDGRDQQIYAAEAGEHIQMDKLVREGYKCILVGKSDTEGGEVTIIGSPSLDTEIHIEVAKGFKGRVGLENVHLSNVKNRPCINLGENSDVILMLKGENKLDKGGIQVPEGAGLTLEGDGMLDIKIDAAEYFGIGNDISSKHGDLMFNHSGIVTVSASGKTGICIGSGLGGNITIGGSGKFVLNIRGNTGVGIGSLYADSKLDICGCAFNADFSLLKGVAIGSMTGSADVRIRKSSTTLNISGKEIAAVGTISGGNAEILINDAIVTINTTGYRCTCVGSLDENTYFKVENASFRAMAGGEQSLPFGGSLGNVKVSLINADTTVKMDSNVDIEKYISAVDIEITSGRTDFTSHGNGVDLKISGTAKKQKI